HAHRYVPSHSGWPRTDQQPGFPLRRAQSGGNHPEPKPRATELLGLGREEPASPGAGCRRATRVGQAHRPACHLVGVEAERVDMAYRGKHRKPSAASRNLARVAVAGIAVGAPLTIAATPAAADSVNWDAIAECESGGDWSINTGNGYY